MNRLKNNVCGASLALVVGTPVAIGSLLLVGGVVELYGDLARSPRGKQTSYVERLVVVDDGKAIIVRDQWQPFRRTRSFDLDRRPVELAIDALRARLADLPAEPRRASRWLRPHRPGDRVKQVFSHGENWFVLFARDGSERCYFQGLNPNSGATVGYIGRDGYQKKKPAADQQFDMAGAGRNRNPSLDRLSGDGPRAFPIDGGYLLSVNFATRTVERLIDEPVVSIDRLRSETGYSEGASQRAVRTAARIAVFTHGGVRRTFVIPAALRGRSFSFYPLESGGLYVTSGEAGGSISQADIDDQSRLHELVWATDSGEVTRRKQMELSSRWPRNRGMSDAAAKRCLIVSVPATIWSAGLTLAIIPLIDSQLVERVSFWRALAHSAGDAWLVVLLVNILCGWLAWLTFKHQRQMGEPNGWFWAVFVFVFGLPGYAGYRLHRSWPYSKPLAAPELTGLEVFAR